MNKADLIVEVQKILGDETSKAAAERAIDAVLAGIMRGVKKDREVQLVGFGCFKVGRRAARRGYDPAAKKLIQIKAARVVKFKAGSELKKLA